MRTTRNTTEKARVYSSWRTKADSNRSWAGSPPVCRHRSRSLGASSSPLARISHTSAWGLIVATAKSIEEGSTDSFGTSFSDAAEKVLTGAQQIGEEYGPQLVVGVTTIVVGGAIRGDLDKNG